MSSRKSLWSQWTHRPAQAARATRSDLQLRSHAMVARPHRPTSHAMVARPHRPTSHGGCRPESCHEMHKGQDHLQGAHGHRAPPHQVLKGWRNILLPRMGRHHSRLTCAAARARTATCSSAASSTKRLAAQAESGREPARHSLREKCNALHCQRVKTRPRGFGAWNIWNCTFRANLAHLSRRTVLTPHEYEISPNQMS